VPSGELRQLTDRPTGQVGGLLGSSGRFVLYLDDQAGDETGHIVRIPWEGGKPVDMTPEMEPYALTGLLSSVDGSCAGFTTSTRDGFQLYVVALDDDGEFTEAPRPLFHSTALTFGPLFSPRRGRGSDGDH